jgi:hypothetical protein
MMHTNHKTIVLAAVVFAIAGISTLASAAPVKEFAGTRGEVRQFCSGEGRHLLEGGAYSLCVTPVSDVTCFDTGVCATTDLRLMLAEGFPRINDVAEANTIR